MDVKIEKTRQTKILRILYCNDLQYINVMHQRERERSREWQRPREWQR
jgi:hypothetical protein